ncbi:TonB-dependent receptor [Pelagicoccus sp. SDUM812003]|uniref:TonB-dependent receptor n=1 Tax=Pelagicoccus sp. SDUM812003 TaxID=3041267 RepID=UPI00280D7517|nr:TonB-dependent receptor [Pelagicoccus sp. SDUM812003]MDQ8204957.1 TonB-dependent receptor [Pelagicoccus sp. SDUM812003]
MSASQGYVGGDDLALATAEGGSDLLEAVPGMIATQHSGTGKAKQYFLRGFNLDHGTDFAAMVDGMQVNFPTHGHGQGYADTNFVIPEMVSMISYLKGPYYAMVGDFSSTGSASIGFKDMLERDFVSASVGEYGRQRLVSGMSRPAAEGNLLFGLELEENDGPWVLDENLAKRSGLLRYSAGNYDERFSVTAMAYDSSWDATDQIPERAIASGDLSIYGFVDPTVGGRTTRYSLSANWRRDQGHVRTFANAYSIYYDMNLWSNFTYFLEDPVNGDQFEQADRRMVYGASFGKTYFYQELFGKQTNHTIALQFRWDDIDQVGLYKTKERHRLSTIREDEVGVVSSGLIYEAKVDWSPKLRMHLGARLDNVDHRSRSRVGMESGVASDWLISPKTNIVYTMNDALEWYASAGYGFHSNDARAASVGDKVDPLVSSQGAELGLRYRFEQRLNTSLSLWRLDLDSELLYVGDAGETEASRPSERWGLDWTSFARLGSGFMADLDVAWSHARFSDLNPAGRHIPGVVERKLGAGLSYGWGEKGRVSLKYRYFGDRPLEESGAIRSRSSETVNVTVRGGNENWEWKILLSNLLDSQDPDISYWYESRLAGEFDAVADVHSHVMKPRSLAVELTRHF